MFRASTILVESEFEGVPEITNVSYDLWVLRITLQFPNSEAPVYVEFEYVSGFRVLDEGQLSELWGTSEQPAGWLWKIESGGWFELESSREGFLLDDLGVSNTPTEYFIAGVNDCINVLSVHEPSIHQAKP